MQTIQNTNSAGGTISKFDYTYDADGQIATWTKQADTTSTNTFTFQYDPVDQLVGAVLTPAGVATNILHQYVYSYDKSGNRTGEQIDTAAVGANHNNLNQMTNQVTNGLVLFSGNISKAGVVGVAGNTAGMTNGTNFGAYVVTKNGTNTMQITATDRDLNTGVANYQLVVTNNSVARTLMYDLNGNLTNATTSTATNTFEWDAADRLTAVNMGTNRSEFTYDGLGRRMKIVEKQGVTVVSTKLFVWCGTELCEERDSTGTNVTKRFFGQGEQISGTNYFYTRDHLGSVREMTDTSGTIHARYDYDPYGRRTKVSGDLEADFAFTGDYFHANSGLYLTLYRAYDPNTGRWISRDPIAETGGLNLYAYVFNNPINAIDPDGRFAWIAIFIIGAVWSAVFEPETANAPGPGDPTYSKLNSEDHLMAAATGGVANVVTAGVLKGAGSALGRLTECPAAAAAADAGGQTFATGKEWYDYYAGKYGAQNVEWTSGSGRTLTWPRELPMPASTEMLRVSPGPRGSGFVFDLESVAGPRPLGAIANHTQPLGLNGVDNGLINGSWVDAAAHQAGHGALNSVVNSVPYGTMIIIKP